MVLKVFPKKLLTLRFECEGDKNEKERGESGSADPIDASSDHRRVDHNQGIDRHTGGYPGNFGRHFRLNFGHRFLSLVCTVQAIDDTKEKN